MSHPEDGRERNDGGVPYGAREARAGQQAGMHARYGEQETGRPTGRDRHGTWALLLSIVGLLLLLLPARILPTPFALTLGAVLCTGAIFIGVQGYRTAGAGAATTRRQALTGLVLGCVGVLLSVLSFVGLVVMLTGQTG